MFLIGSFPEGVSNELVPEGLNELAGVIALVAGNMSLNRGCDWRVGERSGETLLIGGCPESCGERSAIMAAVLDLAIGRRIV